MRKILSLLVGLWVGAATLTLPVWAASKTHKPWFKASTASTKPSMDRRAGVRRSVSRSVSKVARKPYGARPAKSAVSSSGQTVVNQAMKYKGTKYVFGGTNKKGIDCSGFVMRVYHDVKAWKLPRTSAAMYNKGIPIKSSELRPGDLVFFKNTYKRGISHVGIYTGNNKFIHARNKKWGVTVTTLSDPYYQLHYAGARRLYS